MGWWQCIAEDGSEAEHHLTAEHDLTPSEFFVWPRVDHDLSIMRIAIITKASDIRRRLQTSVWSTHGANIDDVRAAVADVGALPGPNGVEEARGLVEDDVVTAPESIVV